MNNSRPIRQSVWTFAFGAYLPLAFGVVLAAEHSALPKVVVIGTGGTIAGSAASRRNFMTTSQAKLPFRLSSMEFRDYGLLQMSVANSCFRSEVPA
jgi:L-asparaginase/Glu-tRNA(Gln) amidotransferase subunit D